MLLDTGTSVYGTICSTREEEFDVKFVAPLPLTMLSQILSCCPRSCQGAQGLFSGGAFEAGIRVG